MTKNDELRAQALQERQAREARQRAQQPAQPPPMMEAHQPPATSFAPPQSQPGTFSLPPGAFSSMLTPEQLPQAPAAPAMAAPVAQQPMRGTGYEEPKKEHPLLQSLKRDLGVEKISTEDVEVGGYKWTLAMMDATDMAYAHRLADALAMTSTERELYFKTACASVAVRAVNMVPVYIMFDIKVSGAVANPLHPDRNTQLQAAGALFNFLNSTTPGLPVTLFEAYQERFDSHFELKSYLNDAEHPRFRYVCTTNGCTEAIVKWPRYVDGTHEHLPYYCSLHGTPMNPSTMVLGDEDLPLP